MMESYRPLEVILKELEAKGISPKVCAHKDGYMLTLNGIPLNWRLGPSFINSNVLIYTNKLGKPHRGADLPAKVFKCPNDSRFTHYEWFKHGLWHRDGDKPAVYIKYWQKSYCQYGRLHRDGDKPAYIDDDVDEFYKNGVRHRDGHRPAVVSTWGEKEWWVYGEQYDPFSMSLEVELSSA